MPVCGRFGSWEGIEALHTHTHTVQHHTPCTTYSVQPVFVTRVTKTEPARPKTRMAVRSRFGSWDGIGAPLAHPPTHTVHTTRHELHIPYNLSLSKGWQRKNLLDQKPGCHCAVASAVGTGPGHPTHTHKSTHTQCVHTTLLAPLIPYNLSFSQGCPRQNLHDQKPEWQCAVAS